MGLLQKAVETYDAMAYRAGKIYAEETEPLAPISHIITRAQIEITLDQDGRFVSARVVDKEEPKIIIPATEASAGRANTAAELPHPLCDYLRYLLPYNETEYSCFISQLSKWASANNSIPKLHCILHYVQSGTIQADLLSAGVVQLNGDGKLNNEKLIVRWVVNGLGETLSGPCWTDQELMNNFTHYYIKSKQAKSASLCMISGLIEPLAAQHIKGVVAMCGNAKLISSNDKSGFTYRGRFSEDWQAATVSYTASQKAHNALRWLVANQGVSFGGRTFLCWSPKGRPVPPPHGPMMRKKQRAADPTQYRQQLRDALSSWKQELPDQEGVVIAAFDAATTGRLAVTYYNELLASDFLQRLHDWDSTCCWENGSYGIQSPYLRQIVDCAFGTLRNGQFEPDPRIQAQQMQRLTACRIDKAPFPLDVERALVEKASNLQSCKGRSAEETSKLRQKLLFTACAAIRKYRYDTSREEWDMALDKHNTDRSYLFGRLLAIAEAVERSTYHSDEDARETNAMRMQKAFALRPLSGWRLLEERLEPYYKQLEPGLRQYYRRMTQDIAEMLSASDGNLNQKLDDIYLLGYYHQRAYRAEKNNKRETEEE